LSATTDDIVVGGRRRSSRAAALSGQTTLRPNGTYREARRFVRSLVEGIKRYETAQRPRLSATFAALANGQKPEALFITCADARIVPNLVASAEPGELFVVRNVANLVPPANGPTEDASVASAVWYALEVLNIRDVIVCGHSSCGGVQALLAPPPPSATLQRWLAPATRAVELWRERGPLDPSFADHDQLSQVSTLHQLDNLRTHEHVRARLDAGNVRLHAWWFDIPSGQLLAYSKAAGRYVPALEALEALDRGESTANAAE
jgi:carbonic anhydrase